MLGRVLRIIIRTVAVENCNLEVTQDLSNVRPGSVLKDRHQIMAVQSDGCQDLSAVFMRIVVEIFLCNPMILYG